MYVDNIDDVDDDINILIFMFEILIYANIDLLLEI